MRESYVENKLDAYCLVCGDQCNISVEQDSRFLEIHLSSCCSSELVELDGSIFEPERVQGREEP
jgi:hypothetical protein